MLETASKCQWAQILPPHWTLSNWYQMTSIASNWWTNKTTNPLSLTTKKQDSYDKNYMEKYKFGKFYLGIWTWFFSCQVNSKLFWKAARFTTITQDLLRCSRNLSFCGSLPSLDLNDTCFWFQLSNHQNIEAKVSFLLVLKSWSVEA